MSWPLLLLHCGSKRAEPTVPARYNKAQRNWSITALASAKLVGRGDEIAADQTAINAMREQLKLLDTDGVVVFGEHDEAPMLFIGEKSALATVPVLISRWVHLQVQHSQQETCLLL